jgi:hypothetical protein
MSDHSRRHVTRIDELAKNLPPPRDLWPAISAAIEADRVPTTAASIPRRSRWLPAVGMAAAVALVAIGILIGQNMGSKTQLVAGTQSTNTQGTAELIPAVLRDANYRKQRDVLLAEVDKRLAAMPPAEREKVAASLLTLRRSISEIEAQLGHDPANALLQELLVNSCQEEMRALTAVRDSGSQEI